MKHNGFEYVDLGLPSGTKWATCNVGADKETDYGLYFAWGETVGYSRITSMKQFCLEDYKFSKCGSNKFTKYNGTDRKNVLDLKDDAVQVNMGGKWHIPTKEQIKELMSNTESTWVSNYNGSGVNGILLTSKSDNSKKLFLPACGFLGNGYSTYASCFVFLLSSSVFSFDDCYSTAFGFNLDAVSVVKCHRAFGFCIRGVFNTFWLNNCSVNYRNLKVGVVH